MTVLHIHNEVTREQAITLLRGLNVARGWNLEIKRRTQKRTLNQNTLMWKWITEVVDVVCRETGNDKEDLHDFFKTKFLKPKIVEIGGETHEVYSTKDLTIQEMSEYMNRIHAFVAGDLGIYLTDPDARGRAA